jgi:glycosyltransferase involved in cell wall biosynthesis
VLEHRGVRVVPLPSPTGKGVEAFAHTAAAIRAARGMCDVLHVHSIGPSSLVPYARTLGHKRVVCTIHAFDYQQRKWGAGARALLRTGERFAVRRADATIAVAEWMADDLARRFGEAADGIHVIPNGPGLLEANAAEGRGVLGELGLEDVRYALFVGRLIPDKRVEDFLEAVSEANSPGAAGGLVPVIVGDSSDTPEYAAFLRGVAPEGTIFAGYRYGPELAALYEGASVFVLPSQVEGLPIALLEAMSRGVPVVASDIEANLEVLGGSDTGLNVPVGDVPALAEAIRSLSADGERRAATILAAKRRVTSTYSWPRIADATVGVYQRVLSPR